VDLVALLLPLSKTTARDGGARSFPEGGVMMTAPASAPARRTKPQTTAALHELLGRIEAEYREMPGLSVTGPQAERLWGLDSTTCSFVLMMLMERGILKRTASGTYVRG